MSTNHGKCVPFNDLLNDHQALELFVHLKNHIKLIETHSIEAKWTKIFRCLFTIGEVHGQKNIDGTQWIFLFEWFFSFLMNFQSLCIGFNEFGEFGRFLTICDDFGCFFTSLGCFRWFSMILN